jgi:hypothetical protein
MKNSLLLTESLKKWYAADAARGAALNSILSNKTLIKGLDMFVTSDSKEIKEAVLENGQHVYSSYRGALKSYGKNLFRLVYRAGDSAQQKGHQFDGCDLKCTTAQANFFRWVYRNDILRIYRNIGGKRDDSRVLKKKRKMPDKGVVGVSVKVTLTF